MQQQGHAVHHIAHAAHIYKGYVKPMALSAVAILHLGAAALHHIALYHHIGGSVGFRPQHFACRCAAHGIGNELIVGKIGHFVAPVEKQSFLARLVLE